MEKMRIPVHTNAKALIFDCDGTLADTMPFHMEAWRKAYAAFGEKWPEDFLEPLKGMKEEQIVDLYNQKYNRQVDSRRLVEEKHRWFQKSIREVKPITPVVDIVKAYRDLLPMAVVSGGKKENVLLTLHVIGLEGVFDVVLTADDKVKPKPAPDIFIEAAWQLKVHPHDCQVFEDGDIGLQAAREAGMRVLDIRPYL